MNLISISELSRQDILRLLDSADAFRARRGGHGAPLQGKSLAMIFEKPSTRTRVSLEVAASELGAILSTFQQASCSLAGGRP